MSLTEEAKSIVERLRKDRPVTQFDSAGRSITFDATPTPLEEEAAAMIERLSKELADAKTGYPCGCKPIPGSNAILKICGDHFNLIQEAIDAEKRNVAADIARLTKRVEELENGVSDPNAVHINMLRGAIAKPSLSQFLHVCGGDVLAAMNNVVEIAARNESSPDIDLVRTLLQSKANSEGEGHV